MLLSLVVSTGDVVVTTEFAVFNDVDKVESEVVDVDNKLDVVVVLGFEFIIVVVVVVAMIGVSLSVVAAIVVVGAVVAIAAVVVVTVGATVVVVIVGATVVVVVVVVGATVVVVVVVVVVGAYQIGNHKSNSITMRCYDSDCSRQTTSVKRLARSTTISTTAVGTRCVCLQTIFILRQKTTKKALIIIIIIIIIQSSLLLKSPTINKVRKKQPFFTLSFRCLHHIAR
jgi:hypothetical protein